MFEFIVGVVDPILRLIGFVIAAGIAFGVLATTVGIFIVIFNSAFFGKGLFAKAFGFLCSGPIAAIYLACAWRICRFAGGYVGSSEYPLQHIVRLIFR